MVKIIKQRTLFSIGVYYFLFVEILTLLVLRCPAHQEHFDKEKQFFADLAASIHSQIEQLAQGINAKQQQQQCQQQETIPTITFPTESKLQDDYGDGGAGNKVIDNKVLTSLSKTSHLVKSLFEEVPLNFTFDFENSTVSVPLSMVAQNLNISDVHMYSPSVDFPLEFVSHNMTYNISISAESIPMGIELHPENSTIPLSLNIDGNNNIPVTLNVQKLESPLLNYLALSIIAGLNGLALVLIVIQQVCIHNLRKRLDAIDVCNEVASGKRIRVGNKWYRSINGDEPHSPLSSSPKSYPSSIDRAIDDDPSSSSSSTSSSPTTTTTTTKTLSNHCLLCSRCGQVNGRTPFCFNCGERLSSMDESINVNNGFRS